MDILIRKIYNTNTIIAFGVWLTVFVIYYLTKAPTLSFWDCGEFIASSYILGVPHPPGSPLYILVGRLFSILPLATEIAVRINLLSVVSSSFAALFGYLTSVRILCLCFKNDNSIFTRIIIYAGSISGTFFLAFGLTNWNNSVETEVYGLSMMMLMAIFWLAMVYMEKKGTAMAERIMLLIIFIAYAGIGVHMTTFLIVPVIAFIIFFKKNLPDKIWYVVAVIFIADLYFIFALSSRPQEIPYYIPITIVMVFYLFYIFSFEQIPKLYQFVGGGFILSILPLLGIGIKAFNAVSGSNTAFDIEETLSTIGKISFVGLLLFGFYLFYKNRSCNKIKKEYFHYLMSVLFIFSAAVMSAILYLTKGYYPFLFVTVIISFIFLILIRKYIDWPVFISIVSISLVILGVKQFFFGLIFGFVLIIILGIFFKHSSWKNALLILFISILGYSVHLFIPIRSAQQPMINENNPSQNLTATINYIERKQYGSQSMIERMFKRRGEWVNQLGDFHRMGFWHFFNEQYGLNGKKFIILFIIGLFGIWEIIRREPRAGVPFFILLLIASIGLVLYMNFADGTRQHPVTGADYIEVRNRDYFFTPAFMLFGLAIGIGTTFIVQFIREAIIKFNPVSKKLIIISSCALFLLPSFTLAKNYYLSDRSSNYIPFDYAWNILTSADENAILITSGDNDTFPLWCLQEVDSVRTDVKVVNLSLSNTKWYIKQLKSKMGINLSWSDEQINNLRAYRDRSGKVFRLQNQVITEIIKENFGRRPINFCVTAPPSSRKFHGKSIDSLLSLNGMVWRMNQTGGGLRKDIEASIDLFTNPDKFKYRGIADPVVYKNETTFRLTRNYARGFMLIADSLKKVGDFETVEWLMKDAIKKIPHSTDAINYLAAFYSQYEKKEELEQLINSIEFGEKRLLKTLLARLERKQGNDEQAEFIYKEIITEHPSYKLPFDELMRLYYEKRQPEKLKRILKTWLEFNPDDTQMKMLLRSVDKEFNKLKSTPNNNL